MGGNPVPKAPNVGGNPVPKAPNVGDKVDSQFPKAPNVGDKVDIELPVNNNQVPNMGDKMSSEFTQSGTDNTKTSSNNGISSKYLASFNIFLKRKNDLEVEVDFLKSRQMDRG